MNVADLMTQLVVAVDPETPLAHAIDLMIRYKVSGLPVVERNDRVAGILTEGDLLRRVEIGTADKPAGWLASFFLPGRVAEHYVLGHGRRVQEVMTPEAITIADDASLSQATSLMQRHHVKRLPVVRNGRLCGIISRADLVRRVGEVLSAAPVSVEDNAISKAIADAIDREPWAHSASVTIAVKHGVVQMDGCLIDLRKREALGVLAESIPGVKRVENRIVCVEPYMGTVIYDPGA